MQRRLARMWQVRKHGPCAAQGPTKRPTYLTKAMRRRKFMIISLMPGVRREASDLQAGRQAGGQAGRQAGRQGRIKGIWCREAKREAGRGAERGAGRAGSQTRCEHGSWLA